MCLHIAKVNNPMGQKIWFSADTTGDGLLKTIIFLQVYFGMVGLFGLSVP